MDTAMEVKPRAVMPFPVVSIDLRPVVMVTAFAVAMVAVMVVVGAATGASGEDPKYPALSLVAVVLGMLLPVDTQRAGFLHLAYACAAGRFAPKEGTANLHEPTMDGGRLVSMATVRPFFFLFTCNCERA